jgi:hypothetical protein
MIELIVDFELENDLWYIFIWENNQLRFHQQGFLKGQEAEAAGKAWIREYMVNQLREQLGGQVEQGDLEDYFRPVVNLTCTAPDVAHAQAIVSQLASAKMHSDGSTEPRVRLPRLQIAYEAAISHVGDTIRCENIASISCDWKYRSYVILNTMEFLAELIAYLKAQGCRDITWSVSKKQVD